MNLTRSSGILAHPTSFPGKYGIGDLGGGAYGFVDFLAESGQRLWQILPLNPTSFGDSPYQSFSAFAGNPLLISPDLLLNEGLLSEADLSDVPDFDPRKVDYGRVIEYKSALYRTAFTNFGKTGGKADFNGFCRKNGYWLDSYCEFVSLKNHFIIKRKNDFETPEYMEYKAKRKPLGINRINDCFYGAAWDSWPQELPECPGEIEYNKFLQYCFFKQWHNLKKYANEREIRIIGDLPIFTAMDSADVWANRGLFLVGRDGVPTAVAGVPPDYFAAEGQLWGNPLYNWREHRDTGYDWWIRRIENTFGLVDMIRIDHFRGFESCWSIPYGEKTAKKGKWTKSPGKELFTAVRDKLGELPVIAEDLGMITKEVHRLRDELGLPGMKVLQFGFDFNKGNTNIPHKFRDSNLAVYTGTHDNDTTVGWYGTATARERDTFRRYLNVSGDEPNWDMLRLALLSSAVIAIGTVQDVLSMGTEDRMNVPGVPSGNWRFRFTEDMLTGEIAERLRYLTELSER